MFIFATNKDVYITSRKWLVIVTLSLPSYSFDRSHTYDYIQQTKTLQLDVKLFHTVADVPWSRCAKFFDGSLTEVNFFIFHM